MHKYCMIISVLSAIELSLFSGCDKPPASGQAKPLKVYRSTRPETRFQYLVDADLRDRFQQAGVTVQFVDAPAFTKPTIDECNVNKGIRFNAREAGTAEDGNVNLEVAETTIWAWFENESPRTLQKLVACTAAHEIGHVYLGKPYHRTGATSIMTPAIDDWMDLIRQCTWPQFNAAESAKIRAKLGY